MRRKTIQIGVVVMALLVLAIGLSSMDASAASPTSAPERVVELGSTQGQPVAHAPYAPYGVGCDPDWTVVPSPNVDTIPNYLNGVAAVSSNDVWAVGNVIEHWNGIAWSIVPGNVGTLNGVAAVSANDVWAVGSSDYQALIKHWDGIAWSMVSSPNSSYTILTGVAAVSANDVWAVGYVAPPLGGLIRPRIEHWDGSAWSEVPNPGGGWTYLTGVSAVSANDVWAVGSSTRLPSMTLIEHWNGSAWSIVSSPNPGTSINRLNGVAAVSANDVWAVGTYGNYSGGSVVNRTLIEHWDGTSWTWFPSPNVGTGNNYLTGVAAVSASDIWAVGNFSNGTVNQTLVEHWNGIAWSIVQSPSSGLFNGVAAVSASDVWAVGNYDIGGVAQTLIERWNGSTWSVVPSPNVVGTGNNSLNGVAAVSSTDVWAVGNYDIGGFSRTLTERWDGSAWSVVPSPNVGTRANSLTGVAAVSSDDVWAVGGYSGWTLIEHWDGSAWKVIPSPDVVGGGFLTGVAAVSSDDVWAVGYHSGGFNWTLVERWNGSAWSVLVSPNPGTDYNRLNSVAAVSANDVWAVGYYSTDAVSRTLVEHWNGSAWSVVPSPNVGTGNNYLNGVAAASANDVWAVGTYFNGTVNQTLVEHWDGIAWSIVQSPNVGTYDNFLKGVTVAGGSFRAVGNYSNGAISQTLILGPGGVVPSPNVGTHDNYLTGVAAVSASDIWAVGNFSNGTVDQTLVERYNPCTGSPTPALTNTSIPTSVATATRTNTALPTNTATATATPDPCLVQYYSITPSTGATIVPGTTDIGNHCYPCTTFITLPFPFTLYSTPYTGANISSSGNVQFVTNLPSSPNTCLPAVGFGPTIFPWWSPQSTVGGSYGIFTSISGVAPNRIFNIEFRTCQHSWTQCGGGNFNYEVRLFEGTNSFDVIYGAMAYNGSSGNVGVQESATSFTQYSCQTGVLTEGLKLSFTQPSCVTPTSTLPVATNTRTPTLTATVTPTQCALQFEDVPDPSTFYAYVHCLACRGIISGYSCGGPGEPCNQNNDPYFRPNNPVTRGQIAKIVSNAAGYTEDPNPQIYEDITSSNTFYQWINRLSRRGHMGGYPCGTVPEEPCRQDNRPYFRPFANATRGQLAKIVSNAAGFSDLPVGQIFADVPPDNGFYAWIQRLASRGIMGGYPCGSSGEPCVPPNNLPYFRSNTNVTRGQTSKIVANTFFPDCQTPANR